MLTLISPILSALHCTSKLKAVHLSSAAGLSPFPKRSNLLLHCGILQQNKFLFITVNVKHRKMHSIPYCRFELTPASHYYRCFGSMPLLSLSGCEVPDKLAPR